MKKIIIILILILPLSVMGRAINPLCNQNEKFKLRNETYNFGYAIEKYKEKDSIFYKVTLLNISNNIVVDYLDKLYYSSNNIINQIKPGSTITLKLIAKPGSVCDGYDIGNKTLVIPNYNVYKDDPLCIGNEEYFLCKENTATKISKEEFTRQLNNYIKTKNHIEEEENEEPNIIKEKDFMKEFLNFISKNYLYIIFGFVSIIVLVVVIKLVKKYNSDDIL